MAMAHPIPGLGKRRLPEPRIKFGRIASAPPDIIRLRQILRPLNAEEVMEIKVP